MTYIDNSDNSEVRIPSTAVKWSNGMNEESKIL